MLEAYSKSLAVQKGNDYHEYAYMAIRLGIRQIRSKQTLHSYINDAIGYRMTPEQPLFYSINSFGTADTISFRDSLLRIHDLKTGITPVSMRQEEVYAALFCLEYKQKPSDINIELRVYQTDEIYVHHPESIDILEIMEKIILFDRMLNKIRLDQEE